MFLEEGHSRTDTTAEFWAGRSLKLIKQLLKGVISTGVGGGIKSASSL